MYYYELLTRLMTKLRLGASCFAVLILVCMPAASVLADNRPNILFIFSDDQSYRTVGAYSQAYPWARTPNIDKLAKKGVLFESAYIGAWCMPARASLLTGLHQSNVESMRMAGQYPGSTYDPSILSFWPEVFRENGYFTAQIGKWHTGVDTGYGRDWDYQIVWNRPLYAETSQNYYYDQPITYQGGKTEILHRYSTDQYTDWAVDLIRGEGRDEKKPWYLWLNYAAVHSPYEPADRHLKEHSDIELENPVDIFPPRPGKPDWAQKIDEWPRGPNGEPIHEGRTLASWVRQYHQSVLALDEGIGRVISALEETGQLENTLIVFASDQGLAWGQHGFNGHKVAAYDSNIRGPLIFSMPSQIAEGAVVEAPVVGIDIVPTLFRFAGIDLPWRMDGNDLTPLLKNPNHSWPNPAMLVSTGRMFGSDTDVIPTGKDVFLLGVPWYVMLRDGQYKYVRPLIDDIEELYDLKADPDELDNLSQKPEFLELLKAMRKKTIAELQSDQVGFVNAMPPVQMEKMEK